MRFWLDSANLQDIEWARTQWGVISGVTVNQSLLAKEPKRPLDKAVEEIIDTVRKSMSLSIPLTITGEQLSGRFLQQAIQYEKFDKWGMKLYFKIPVSRETLPAIAHVSANGIPVNATCIFTGLQAALAAEAGAQILSIFVGRINDDMPGYGWKVIEAAKKVCGDAEVLAGSIRDKPMVAAACDHGADIVTTSRRVLDTLAEERGTALSVAKFNADLEAWMA